MSLDFNATISLATLITLVIIAIKLIAHLSVVNKRVEELWKALMGDNPADSKSFFYRFAIIEKRVEEMWERLQFGKLAPDRRKQEESSE